MNGLAIATALILVAAGGCGSGSAGYETVDPPVRGLVTRLQDETRDKPGNRIAWSTFWTLCWDAYPGAVAYELETLTAEGSSPNLRRQRGRCLRIEAAAGENEPSQGMRNRRVLLALQGAQLAYRVRANLDEGRVSEWSRAIAVGATGAPASRRASHASVR